MTSEKKENREMDCCPVIRFSWNAMGLMKRFIDFEPINNFLLLLLLSTIIVSGSIVLIFFQVGRKPRIPFIFQEFILKDFYLFRIW